MPPTAHLLLALIASTLPTLASAQVFRCADSSGKLHYSDQPCAANQQASQLRLPAPAPAPTAQSAPRLSPQAAAYEKERQLRLQQSNDSHQRIDTASAKVQQIRSANHNPQKCAQVRGRLDAMQQRDPLLHKTNPDYADFSQKASLYCGN